jgi:hypothetical protein
VPGDPDHRVVRATVIGVPAPGTVVWRADGERTRDGSPVSGDLDDPEERLRSGDHVVIEVVRDRFRWLVVDVVDVVPTPRSPERPRRPHAHPARPPGTVLIAWLPFTRDGDEGPGKHRPCIVLRSTDPDVIRARPLYDPGSAVARSSGGVQLQAWRAAGLDKASVAVDPVEIPVGRCEQTLGQLAPVDLSNLGIVGRRQR